MKIFTAQSNRGLVLKCIAFTYVSNLLLAPIMAIASTIGGDPNHNFTLYFIEIVAVEWTLPMIVGILWGIFIRKQNGPLLAKNKEFFLNGLVQRQIFVVSILAAIVGPGLFFFAGIGGESLLWVLYSLLPIHLRENLFVSYIIRQLFSSFTAFSIIFCLLFTFHCKSIKTHTAYGALVSRP